MYCRRLWHFHYFILNPFEQGRCFFFLWGYFHEKQRNWAPCQRREHSGPESKVAICLRALCQQFSRITLSTTSLWSKHGCSSNARPGRRLGTETVGGERCNLSVLSCEPKASVDYRSPVFCGQGCVVPSGLHPAETGGCRKIICLYCIAVRMWYWCISWDVCGNSEWTP